MVLFYTLIAVIIFCFSARQFLRAVTQGVDWERRSEFSLQALRFEKNYRIWAWGLMSFVWIYLCAISFWQSFTADF